MAFLFPFKGFFQRTTCCPGVQGLGFFYSEHRNHALLDLCYSLVSYSYLAMIERNGLLLLVTVVSGAHSALSLLVVELLLPFSEESPTMATLLSLHVLLNSSWSLQSLQTPLFLQLHWTNLAISQYQRLTHTATQGQAQQSTELFHRICYCFCWATSNACGYFLIFANHRDKLWNYMCQTHFQNISENT